MDIVYKGFIKRMEKANNDMMMDENSRSWYVLYTAPRLERKLMQHLLLPDIRLIVLCKQFM
jgi:hypothetical protein